MECVSPVFIMQNGKRLFVPCGKCYCCLSRRRNDWTFRLKNEQKNSFTAHFCTLTYSDETLPEDGKLKKRDLQLFLKRLRTEQDRSIERVLKADKMALKWPSIKYYACGEYGTKTKRPHYHAIIFNIHPRIFDKVVDIWKMGHVVVVPSNVKTIHYVTKYVINNFEENYKGFSLISKGIGNSYLSNTQKHRKGLENFVINDGYPMAMPRYYKNKIYTKIQRSIIANRTERSMIERYEKNIDSISLVHEHPIRYTEEAKRLYITGAKCKINKNNKI